jgi:hypothetical protein
VSVASTRRWSIGAVALFLVAATAVLAFPRPYYPEPVSSSNAAGDATCLSCHRQKASFETTAHHFTSRLASRDAILGSFTAGENAIRTINPDLRFRMDSTASGFYETAIVGHASDTTARSERIDIVTGVRKGQSFLYWHADSLFQLPLSYWSGVGWINSPGYRDGVLDFSRPILPRCVECHATSLESVPDLTVSNRYLLTSVRLGVSCETCHASGLGHVARERSPFHVLPTRMLPSRIVNPERLPRERQLDACALCHGGLRRLKTPAFSYLPGQPLDGHLAVPFTSSTEDVDVHGNQVALLERSACFRSSQMSCATCHDVHQTQRDVVGLSGRCLSCHKLQRCGLFPQRGQALLGQCVTCHMPEVTSNTIISNRNGRQERPQVRTHWIKVYTVIDAR